MKLLKFANGDAPQEDVALEFDPSLNNLTTSDRALRWNGMQSEKMSVSSYYIVMDNGKIVPLTDVVVMRPDTQFRRPGLVTDEHISGLDLRNKAGQRLDASKAEYGRTYAKAQSKPMMMNADIQKEKRNEYNKRERDALEDAIDRGEKPEKKARGRKSAGSAVAAAEPTEEKKEKKEKKSKKSKE